MLTITDFSHKLKIFNIKILIQDDMKIQYVYMH